MTGLIESSGFAQFFVEDGHLYLIMVVIALLLIYLAIVKGFEPLLLLPISFGILLANLPGTGVMTSPADSASGIGGVLYYVYQGIHLGIFPPLIFLGVGALTDFGPLIANPKSVLLGISAQFGIFAVFIGAMIFGFTPQQASAIGIIGSADGPTAIFTTQTLAPELLATIAIAAYSYMALVPVIQPPIMRALTTKAERAIQMDQLRVVSRRERIMFPVCVTIVVTLLVPTASPLIGMMMLGNLFKESGVTAQLGDASAKTLLYPLTIFVGLSIGATTDATRFLTAETLGILSFGMLAFALSTASGVLFGKVLCKLSGGKVNPLIGAAGVSAMPMSARVVQKVGQEENPHNFLLMHAMGPTVASTIGSALVAGVFIALFG